ncbi:DUF6894 family protein [Bradyrhizobium daqingense]|uniref:DUF6894 family protein n=1 Tax=Bradyrhizobium daqingense TaxID=993502 RepID=UPI00384D23B4
MPRFYFDIWDGESLVIDEEGLSLAGRRAAEIEAALLLRTSAFSCGHHQGARCLHEQRRIDHSGPGRDRPRLQCNFRW